MEDDHNRPNHVPSTTRNLKLNIIIILLIIQLLALAFLVLKAVGMI